MAQENIKFQRKVNSLVSGKKKLDNWREPESPVRFAFMKLLRERDKTGRVYDIDPFVEVYDLRPGIFGLYTESLDGMGDAWIFVIEGEDRGLVIDTSFGLGNLKGLIHELIGGKPYDVANTHNHFDHAYGNYQFDRVYCHEYEEPKIRSNMNEHVWDYLFDENGEGIWYDFKREDLCGFKEYELIGVPDGYTFRLGPGHEVELIFMGGHSTGHCGFLDKKNRIFFPGDDCCVGAIGIGGQKGAPFGEYATVEAMCKEMKKIYARRDEFDSMFPSHGPVETGPIMLLSAIEACEAVLADPLSYDTRRETARGIQFGKMIFESGYLNYTASSVYMDRDVEELR